MICFAVSDIQILPRSDVHGISFSRGLCLGLALVFCFFWGSSTTVLAQDRVTQLSNDTGTRMVRQGQILDLKADVLTLLYGASTIRIPFDQVLQIETPYTATHQAGLQLLEISEQDEAIVKLTAALKQEPREWVQREIYASLMKARLRKNDLGGALASFRKILETDPETRHWGIAPLCWNPTQVPSFIVTEYTPLLRGSRAAEQLLAACLLLNDPLAGGEAVSALKSLVKSSNRPVAILSKAQLWRLELAKQSVSDGMLEDWQNQLRYFPKWLKSGPQYLLGRGYDETGSPRSAATEFVKIGTLYSENESLAAAAQFQAAELLQRSGVGRESQILYHELKQRYPWAKEIAQIPANLR